MIKKMIKTMIVNEIIYLLLTSDFFCKLFDHLCLALEPANIMNCYLEAIKNNPYYSK